MRVFLGLAAILYAGCATTPTPPAPSDAARPALDTPSVTDATADRSADVVRALGSFHGRAFDRYDPTLPEVDAIGYELDLRVDDASPGMDRFSATLAGTFVATQPIDALTLDFQGNDLDAAEIDGAPVRATREGDVLTLPLGSTRAPGAVIRATVRYHGALLQSSTVRQGDFVTYGGLIASRPNAVGRPLFLSLDWPARGRRWIPMRDHPRDGVMTVVRATFPRALTVLSNGRREELTDNPDGTRTWRYACLTQMPPYDLHVAAYDGWTEGGSTSGPVPARWFTYAPHAAAADAIYRDIPAALDFFSTRFGAFRWEQVGYAEVPIFGGGMEHATVVSMDESLFDPASAASSRQVAVHELAHHWSGNLVRIRTWNDFWLSEGFTEYLTARFINEHDGAAAGRAVWNDFLRRATSAELRNARARHPVRPPDPEVDPLSIFDAVSYQRGAWTLRMVESRVGVEGLTEFLRGWFSRHAEEAVTTDDLARELAARFPDADLPRFFDEWVFAQGFPVLSATVANGALTVAQVQTRGPDGGFHATVEVALSDGARSERVRVALDGAMTTQTLPAGFTPTRVEVDPDGWLYALPRCDTPGATCRAGTRCASSAAGMVCTP